MSCVHGHVWVPNHLYMEAWGIFLLHFPHYILWYKVSHLEFTNSQAGWPVRPSDPCLPPFMGAGSHSCFQSNPIPNQATSVSIYLSDKSQVKDSGGHWNGFWRPWSLLEELLMPWTYRDNNKGLGTLWRESRPWYQELWKEPGPCAETEVSS